GKHKCALPVWITWKGLRKNVKIIHILKKAGYKIGLPFGTDHPRFFLYSGRQCPIIYYKIGRGCCDSPCFFAL
ncbi:MAG: hypothetical protein II992_08130, partial [Lachnospiraceae bacterium]|nr:hypothetical protein [Lachnospiraceae bacterium]